MRGEQRQARAPGLQLCILTHERIAVAPPHACGKACAIWRQAASCTTRCTAVLLNDSSLAYPFQLADQVVVAVLASLQHGAAAQVVLCRVAE